MNLLEQLNKVKSAKAAKQLEIKNLLTKALDEDATPDEAVEENILTLEEEVATLEKNVERISKLIADSKQAEDTAEEVSKDKSMNKSKIEVTNNLDKGIGYAKYAKSLLTSQLMARKGQYVSPLDIAKSRNEPEQVIDFMKAVATTTANGYAPLVQPQNLQNEFVDLLRANTVFDKLATQMTNVPFNVRVPTQTKAGTGAWVGEGALKPTTNQEFSSIELKRHKMAGITVISEELLMDSNPTVDVLIRNDLVAALTQLTDDTFLSDVAGSAVKPSGLLNGVTAVTASGRTVADYTADIAKLKVQFIAANLSLAGAYFIMSEVQASELSSLRDTFGNSYFKGMDSENPVLENIPVYTTQNAGSKIILVKPSELLVADEGGIRVDQSMEATVDGVSLWQNNLMGIRVERHITWAKRSPTAASFIDYSAL